MSANIGMKVVLGVLNKNKACKEYIAIFSIAYYFSILRLSLNSNNRTCLVVKMNRKDCGIDQEVKTQNSL